MPSIPDIPGNPMSTSAIWGRSRAILTSASSMEGKAPVQEYPSVPLINVTKPSRISRRSSMTVTLIREDTNDLFTQPDSQLSDQPLRIILTVKPAAVTTYSGGFLSSPHPVEQGGGKGDHSAGCLLGRNFQRCAQVLGPPPYAHESMAFAGLRGVKPSAVVLHHKDQVMVFDSKLNLRPGTGGM